MTIRGELGELRWGYQVAVVLRPWLITRTESGSWALTGTVERADTFRLSQQPLVFASPNGWRWPVESLQISGASLSAVLGPKERTWNPNSLTPHSSTA